MIEYFNVHDVQILTVDRKWTNKKEIVKYTIYNGLKLNRKHPVFVSDGMHFEGEKFSITFASLLERTILPT